MILIKPKFIKLENKILNINNYNPNETINNFKDNQSVTLNLIYNNNKRFVKII